MKKILLVLLCAVSFPSFGQLTVNRKIAQRWDKYVSNNWQGQDSLIFLYDAYGNETFRFAVAGQTNSWINNYRTTATYDAQQNLSTRTHENWTSNGWQNINKYSYSYNSNNLKTETIYQTWANNSWKNTGRLLNIYNGNQLKSQSDSYTWDGNAWQPGTRQLFFYNSSNELITHEHYFFSNGIFEKQERLQYQYAFGFVSSSTSSTPDGSSNWVPRTRTLNLINGSATPPHLATSRIQWRDLINVTWVDSLRTTYSYNGNLLIQSESERYYHGTATWVNQQLNTYDYNTAHQLIEEKNHTYLSSTSSYQNTLRKLFTYNANNLNNQITFYDDDGNNGWKVSSKSQLTYNGNDSLIYRLNENYTNSSFTPHEQYFYHYADVPVGINNYNNLFDQAKLYPNPANDVIQIKTNEKMQGAFVASIYTMQGKKVWSQYNSMNPQELQFDVSSLPLGNYIIQINEISTGRFQHLKFSKL